MFATRCLVFALFCAAIVTAAACSGGSQMPTVPSQPVTNASSSSASFAYARLMSATEALNNVAGFSLVSSTFKNGTFVPKSMIGIAAPQCNGGDKSPALFWSNRPAGTKSFALVMFDETANFGHWGIYNMSFTANRLPEGVKPGNTIYWKQVTDDAGVQGYFGPCPPPPSGVVHHYVFTIYALDTGIALQSHTGLPGPNIESLLFALSGHVLARASITGFARF